MKKCKQCMKSNPMLVRWVMYNYGQIPWTGFLMPKQKERIKKIEEEVEARIKTNKGTLYVVDETEQMPPEFHDEVHSYLKKEMIDERDDTGADEERAD